MTESNHRSGHLNVVFDNTCPLCIRSARLISKLDTDDRIVLVPISKGQLPEQFHSIDQRELFARMHVALEDGSIASGADAIAVILHRLPGWRWLGWFLSWPGVRQLARWGYTVLARNRYRIFGIR